MLKYFFHMRYWQPLPVENHLLHNEVAQLRIEGEINAEAVLPLRSDFWRHACQSHDLRVSSLHSNPVNAGCANINPCPLSFQEICGSAIAFSGRSEESGYATKICRSQVQSKTDTAQNLMDQSSIPASLFSRVTRSIMALVAHFLSWNFVKFAD